MKKFRLIAAALLIIVTACSKKESEISDFTIGSGVLVLNEGQFQQNNASITYINNSGKTTHNIFSSFTGRLLGDILQSYAEIQGDYFFVVNNSNKIERIDKTSFKSKGTITGLNAPRYILEIPGSGLALISNLSGNKLDVLQLSDNRIIDSISVSGWCEQMVYHKDKIFVANTGDDKLLVIDPTSRKVTGSRSFPPQPASLTVDKNSKIWVVCSGNFGMDDAALCRYNPATDSIELNLKFNTPNAFPGQLKGSQSGEYIYFIENGLYKMSVNNTAIPSKPLISEGTYPYGLGIDAAHGKIYIGDAVDFTSSGKVRVYDDNGILRSTFVVGVGPRDFVFR